MKMAVNNSDRLTFSAPGVTETCPKPLSSFMQLPTKTKKPSKPERRALSAICILYQCEITEVA